LILFILFSSGCSSIKKKQDETLMEQTPQERIKSLSSLQQWKIQGKIAFIDKNVRESATLSWSINEHKNSQALYLTTYLGINVLQLNSNNGSHEIIVEGKSYYGENLEVLIHSITGLTLPSNALTFWLKGLPYQQSDEINYHQSTQLPQRLISHYNNELWQVDYANYQQIKGYNLATNFTVKKNNLLIKIVINDWLL
jgi:outer membrane lipoprotein LolB